MFIPKDYIVTVALAPIVREAVKGTNPHALAAATGIPRTTLKRRLAGNGPFTFDELEAIANHLGCKVSDFVLAAEQAAA